MRINQTKYKFCPFCKTDLKEKVIDNENVLNCSNCGFIFWNNPKPVVSIILENHGKILMLQRTNEPFKNYWCLPGGFISHEETPEEAIKREVKEETGLDLEIKNIVGSYRIDNDPRGIHIDIIYNGIGESMIKLSSEDTNYAFFEPDNLPEQIAYKHREAINDWLKKSKSY